MDLLSIFDAINVPSGQGDFAQLGAVPIPNYPHFHLAKSDQGLPSILISVRDSSGNNPTPSITLEHISVYFDVFCRVTKSDSTMIEGTFTVIHCTGREKLLHIYFLHITQILFDLLPELPTKPQVSKAINTLVDLFRAASSPTLKTIQGFWAELLLIDTAVQPEVLVSAWHVTPFDRYDFNLHTDRLEVKSTSQRVREHHFSLEQVMPIEDTKVVVASLFVEQVNSGMTVMQMVDSIRTKIAAFPNLVLHFDRIVATTLGDNWRTAFEEAFDKQLALSMLQFYDVCNIPAPHIPLPEGVSDVHFKANLTFCEPIDLKQFLKTSSLFASLRKT